MLEKINDYLAKHDWSETTRERYRRALLLFLKDGGDFGTLTASGFRKWLEKRGWARSTQWVAYNAVRGFIRSEFGDDHPALEMDLKRPQIPPQRSLDLEQVQKLLYSFDTSSVKGRRDLAICALFLDTGLRVSEMCRIDLKYLDLDTLLLSVLVKRRKWHTMTYSPETANFVAAWLADRMGITTSYAQVFISVGGNTPGCALTRHGLQTIVKLWGLRAEIGHLSPHDLRRTFTTISSERGASERVLMEQGGWSTSEMIKRYTRNLRLKSFLKYSPVSAAMRHTAE